MKTFIIKVLWTGEKIVFRDLLLSENHSLLDLHEAILSAFDLNADQMAGFTKIDDELGVEVDYQLEAFDEKTSLMKDVKVKEVFKEEGDFLDYTYDFLNEVSFGIELIEIKEANELKVINVLKSKGELPKDLFEQVDPEDAESILIQAMLGEEDEDDEYKDLFDSDDYESLDDLEDY